MPDDKDGLLALAQWLSPAFPVGAFAYSHGLERQSPQATSGTGRASGIGSRTCSGSARAGRMRSFCRGQWTRTRSRCARGMGLCFGRVGRARARSRPAGERIRGHRFGADRRGRPLLPYPVAVGAAARQLKLPTHRVAAFYLQSFAGSLVSAAVRLVPLGQTEGQCVLASLRPTFAEVAAEAACAPLAAIGLAAFGAELAAMHHETMSPRMFRT